MQNDWAYNEFFHAPLWDTRCRSTLTLAAQQLAEQSQLSFSRALGSRRKAVSHILHHQETTAADLLRGHVGATSLRCQAHAFVLVASDTTVCDFTTHKAVEGLGPICDKAYQRGFFLHSALALTPTGVPLGLVHQQTWTRDPAQEPTAGTRRKRGYADKESHKWLEALRGVESALPAALRVLLIQDREADIFAFFCAPRRANLDLLIRATQPRCIEVETPDMPHTLLQASAQAQVVASKTVAVHARPDRPARDAHLTVRLVRARVRAPRNGSDPKAASVWMWVVRACEENPPPEVKEPITWILLTTLANVDAPLAVQLVDYYALRWRIERFHFVLKSGCGYERLQCDTLAALRKALSLYSIVAWRLLFIMYLARDAPDMPAHEILCGVECEVLQRYLGKPIHTARDAMLAVARFAGFVAVPSAPLPGVKSLWLGFRKLHDAVTGYLLARQPAPP